jgi:hypothetical protein
VSTDLQTTAFSDRSMTHGEMTHTPCADVINSHPLLILGGQLPPSFPKFLEWLAHPPKTTAAVKRSLL